jgi:hypothetical protein
VLHDVARRDRVRALEFGRLTAALVAKDAAESAREAALEIRQGGAVI